MKTPAFSHLFTHISWRVLKITFRSLQIWKFSGGGYPQLPYKACAFGTRDNAPGYKNLATALSTEMSIVVNCLIKSLSLLRQIVQFVQEASIAVVTLLSVSGLSWLLSPKNFFLWSQASLAPWRSNVELLKRLCTFLRLGFRTEQNRKFPSPHLVPDIVYYDTLYSLSAFSLAKSLQLILEISAAYRLADNWLICRLRAQCMITNNWLYQFRFLATVCFSLFSSKQCIMKQLSESVFVIS